MWAVDYQTGTYGPPLVPASVYVDVPRGHTENQLWFFACGFRSHVGLLNPENIQVLNDCLPYALTIMHGPLPAMTCNFELHVFCDTLGISSYFWLG